MLISRENKTDIRNKCFFLPYIDHLIETGFRSFCSSVHECFVLKNQSTEVSELSWFFVYLNKFFETSWSDHFKYTMYT